MIGYHSVSVIADALAKGNINFDVNRALHASVNTSRQSYFDGLGDYMELNYVPEDRSGSSVSKTLEYAYNDWCIAQMAIAAGKDSLAAEYILRSQNFENCYDPKIGFMRPKLANGSWKKEFNPMDTHGQGFIEGNAWNYGLYVPHQVDQMIEMMGGNEIFIAHLDSLFTMEIADEYIANNEDITRDGIIGNYVQGNEPGHHIPYLYNWANAASKTQERVRMIMETMYSNGRDGLCGNDDAGQMSAWYVFSAMGFYPVCPGSPDYAIGSPLVKEAKLNFENGNTLRIKAKNQTPENVFVARVELNGKIIEGNTLNHFDLMKGGDLVFYMSNTANTK
jgi:predicted alpha-1,2-mannosidase